LSFKQIYALKSGSRASRARLHQERFELPEPPFAQMSELPIVKIVDGRVQALEQLQSGAGNPRPNDPAILLFTSARDEPPLFEPIHQPRHVRIVPDEPSPHQTARQAGVAGAAQDPQDVVLRRREVRALQQLDDLAFESFRGGDQRQIRIDLRGRPRAPCVPSGRFLR
jgi:hypothetical protein